MFDVNTVEFSVWCEQTETFWKSLPFVSDDKQELTLTIILSLDVFILQIKCIAAVIGNVISFSVSIVCYQHMPHNITRIFLHIPLIGFGSDKKKEKNIKINII